jgi:hypothetical protein
VFLPAVETRQLLVKCIFRRAQPETQVLRSREWRNFMFLRPGPRNHPGLPMPAAQIDYCLTAASS